MCILQKKSVDNLNIKQITKPTTKSTNNNNNNKNLYTA